MSRDDGFAIADVSTSLYSHPRVVALARLLRDGTQTAAHVAIFEAVLLASWGAGRRLTLDEACPAWWLDPVDELRANLQAVGLLDSEARIPDDSWASWFEPAFERREARRESGRLGGQRSGAARTEASLQRRSGGALAVLNPSVPTVPSVPTGPSIPTDRQGGVSGERRARRSPRGGVSGASEPSGKETTNGARTEPCARCGTEPSTGRPGRMAEVAGSWQFLCTECEPPEAPGAVTA